MEALVAHNTNLNLLIRVIEAEQTAKQRMRQNRLLQEGTRAEASRIQLSREEFHALPVKGREELRDTDAVIASGSARDLGRDSHGDWRGISWWTAYLRLHPNGRRERFCVYDLDKP